MIHLSQSRSSAIFEREGDSLSILYWGKKIANLGSDFEKSIESALHKASAHGGLDVAVGNLVLREHSRG
jgi:alpha-galactosidase